MTPTHPEDATNGNRPAKTAILSFFLAFLLLPLLPPAAPTIHVLSGEQMRIDLAGSSVTANGSEWNVTLRMQDDNENPSLGSSFRRWWHVELQNLNTTTGDTLNVTVTNSGYSDYIVPVWSPDGGDNYTRIPSGESSLSFSVTTPPGVASVRLAKYFPYTLTAYDAFRASINTHPHVTESVIGSSSQSRSIYMYEITDSGVSNAGKTRVWIHTAVHPSENTAYFVTEGLINWLTSGASEPEILLDHVIFDIVPMANPDGVALGNYRTNADSVNLEIQWGAPYNSTVPEVVALRTQIETFMGVPGSPGPNPIKVLLNLHSSHGLGYPFHYVHDASVVSPSVNALEQTWVWAFEARSAFVALGSSQASYLSGRPYVESMMYDRYSSQPDWDNVMAITFEGTYQLGPTPGVPSTDDDYRQVGREMGLALADFLGIDLTVNQIGSWMLLY